MPAPSCSAPRGAGREGATAHLCSHKWGSAGGQGTREASRRNGAEQPAPDRKVEAVEGAEARVSLFEGLQAAGLSARHIAYELTEREVATPANGRCHAQTVIRSLQRLDPCFATQDVSLLTHRRQIASSPLIFVPLSEPSGTNATYPQRHGSRRGMVQP